MATITKQQAVERLAAAIEKADADDIVAIYDEVFPEAPAFETDADRAPSALLRKIIAHFDAGLEVEEILDLWHVVFPGSRRVWFDEEEDLLHYDEKIERVGHSD